MSSFLIKKAFFLIWRYKHEQTQIKIVYIQKPEQKYLGKKGIKKLKKM